MELSDQDSLRLNVLLANQPLALRLDEGRMVLHALLARGESSISLCPSGRDDHYLKTLRAFLSERVLGSPGGYPFYLQRWTRQGRMRPQSLEQLLLLADPEAVFAVVCSVGLDVELARRAWWARPEAEVARRLLQTAEVRDSQLGRELAGFLVDYLPFETEDEAIIASVRLLAHPGLLCESQRQSLWRKARRKTSYLVGFLASDPVQIPGDRGEHPQLCEHRGRLEQLSSQEVAGADTLLWVCSSAGQNYLSAVRDALVRPNTQEQLAMTLDLLRSRLQVFSPQQGLVEQVELLESVSSANKQRLDPRLIEAEGKGGALLHELCLLASVGYPTMRPLLGDGGAMGSLMRRKLAPLLDRLQQSLSRLLP